MDTIAGDLRQNKAYVVGRIAAFTTINCRMEERRSMLQIQIVGGRHARERIKRRPVGFLH